MPLPLMRLLPIDSRAPHSARVLYYVLEIPVVLLLEIWRPIKKIPAVAENGDSSPPPACRRSLSGTHFAQGRGSCATGGHLLGNVDYDVPLCLAWDYLLSWYKIPSQAGNDGYAGMTARERRWQDSASRQEIPDQVGHDSKGSTMTKKKTMGKKGYIYFVTNRYNTVLYTGVTNSLVRRSAEHGEHQGSDFTQRYNCGKLVYFEVFPDIDQAITREKQLKHFKREWKDQLVNVVNPEWRDLRDGMVADPEERPGACLEAGDSRSSRE